MIARTLAFALGLALTALPLHAETPAGWTRTALPGAGGTVATPCSDAQRVQPSTHTLACDIDGVSYVVDVSGGAQFMGGEYGETPYELVRDDLLRQSETRRLVETEVAGLRSFRSDGSATNGGIGMGVVEIRPDLMLTVMVRIVGDEVTHEAIETALDDIMDSLEIASQ